MSMEKEWKHITQAVNTYNFCGEEGGKGEKIRETIFPLYNIVSFKKLVSLEGKPLEKVTGMEGGGTVSK